MFKPVGLPNGKLPLSLHSHADGGPIVSRLLVTKPERLDLKVAADNSVDAAIVVSDAFVNSLAPNDRKRFAPSLWSPQSLAISGTSPEELEGGFYELRPQDNQLPVIDINKNNIPFEPNNENLMELAYFLESVFGGIIDTYKQQIEKMFEPFGLGKIIWRSKSAISIYRKLKNKIKAHANKYDRAKLVYEVSLVKLSELLNPSVSDSEKLDKVRKEVEKAKRELELLNNRELVRTRGDAINLINDGIGIRYVVDDVSATGIQQIVNAMIHAMESGIHIIGVNNYHGKYTNPYFNRKNMNQFLKNLVQHSDWFEWIGKEEQQKKSGYKSLQFDLLMELFDRVLVCCDLQIKGKETNKTSEAEHFIYKLNQGDYDDVLLPSEELESFKKMLQSYPADVFEKKYADYLEYLNQYYAYSDQVDLGIDAETPQVPSSLQNDHSLFAIEKLYDALLAANMIMT